MKKLSVLLLVGVLLTTFYACEKETVVENQPLVDQIDVKTGIDQSVDGKFAFKHICIYFYEFGRWQFNPWSGGFSCNPRGAGICSVKKICFPVIVHDPCWLIPCWLDIFDPWDIYKEIDPRKFASFKDKLELDIDPRVSSVPFAINEKIMGLQFYEKNSLMSFEGKPVFALERDMVFDAETSKEIGLQGNAVKAGEYPILYNKENGTFNVILSVEKGFEQEPLRNK